MLENNWTLPAEYEQWRRNINSLSIFFTYGSDSCLGSNAHVTFVEELGLFIEIPNFD